MLNRFYKVLYCISIIILGLVMGKGGGVNG